MTLKALQKNDIVDVVAPGFKCTPENLEKARAYLIQKGFRPRIPDNILGDSPIHSNVDEVRAEHLIRALEAKDSKAIWFLRGGYGSNKLLPYLKKIKKAPKPKLTIGISDITSLHSFFIDKWGWSALHGCLLDRLGQGIVPPDVEEELLNVVTGELKTVTFENLEPLNSIAKSKKVLKHEIVGGNLTVVQSHLGTANALKIKNRILMLEDIGERGYRVDRMLFHLEQAGALKECKGVIFGTFTSADEPNQQPSTVPWVLETWAQKQKFPVLRGLPCGHDTVQRVLPVGTRATLKLNSQSATLEVPTGVKK